MLTPKSLGALDALQAPAFTLEVLASIDDHAAEGAGDLWKVSST
jgi:hypothetical protein